MSYFDSKPCMNYCKKDGNTHRNFEYLKRRTKHSGTVEKLFIGGDNLSKKKRSNLYNSTYDNLMPGLNYSLNKSRYWDIFESPIKALEKFVPYNNEYSVAVVKSQKLDGGGAYKSFALKDPYQKIKFIEVKSGNGASFKCLHNELVELEPKKKGEKRKKYSGIQSFRETPSVLYSVEERHPSDNVFGASIYRYRDYKWSRKEFHQKINSIDICEVETEEFYDENEPCVSNQTNLTFGDCFVQKSFQNHSRRKNIYNSFEEITFEDSAFDKIKQTPKVVFESSLTKQSIESMVFSYNKNSISSLNFETIDFMYDLLWLNEEKTKCLFIIPKSLNVERSNFDSFMILEFFGGKKKRLRVTTNSIHKRVNFPSNDVCLNLKTIICNIWRTTSINNSEMYDSVKKPSMLFHYPNALFSTNGVPVGDFDLLFQHQPKSVENNDFEILTNNSRCNICNYKNATSLNRGHSFCQECATKMIKHQIENYSDKLCCSFCSTHLDPIFIFYSTPLLLLRAYLRSKFFEDKNTVNCPNCNDVLIFEKKDALNIKCKQCGILFCQHCKQAPHFPLSCSKMNQWTKQMLKQYWFFCYGDFECTCKNRIELSRYHENLEYENKKIRCLSCQNQYILSWPQMKLPRMLNYRITKFIEIDSPHFLSNSVASVSIDVFSKKITMKYQNKMVKKIANISSLSSSEARAIVIESLHFLEFGTAHLHLNRKHLTENDKIFKKYLHSLRSVMIQIEICDEKDANAKRKIALWQKLLDKISFLCTVQNHN